MFNISRPSLINFYIAVCQSMAPHPLGSGAAIVPRRKQKESASSRKERTLGVQLDHMVMPTLPWHILSFSLRISASKVGFADLIKSIPKLAHWILGFVKLLREAHLYHLWRSSMSRVGKRGSAKRASCLTINRRSKFGNNAQEQIRAIVRSMLLTANTLAMRHP